MNNLKQIGLCIMTYNNDYDNWSMPMRFTKPAGTSISWCWMLINDKYITTGMIFSCPGAAKQGWLSDADIRWRNAATSTYILNSTIYNYTEYGYNGLNLGAWFSTSYGYPLPKMNQIRIPWKTIMNAETYDQDNLTVNSIYVGVYNLFSYKASGSIGQLWPIHNGFVNTSWTDGHVTSQKASNFPYQDDPFRNGNIAGGSDNHWDIQ